RRRVQLLPPDARPHHAALARRPRYLDERSDRVPALQRPQAEPPAAGVRRRTPLRTLHPEQGRIPDPHQPPHPRGPDGVSEAARRVPFATGLDPCLISGVIPVSTFSSATPPDACASRTTSCAPMTCARRHIGWRRRVPASRRCRPPR